jgi:hypothetical protein
VQYNVARSFLQRNVGNERFIFDFVPTLWINVAKKCFKMTAPTRLQYNMAAKVDKLVIGKYRANMLRKSKTSAPLSHLQACEVYSAKFGQVFGKISCDYLMAAKFDNYLA